MRPRARAAPPGAPHRAHRRRPVRAPRRALGGRPVRHRAAADGRPALAHRRRLPRRRSPTPGSRSRTSTGCRPTPAPVGMGMSEGGVDRGRGGAAPPPDVDQRRRRAAGPGRLDHRRDAGRRRAACAATSCASAPCGSRPTPRCGLGAGGGGGRVSRLDHGVAGAVRGDVGGQLDRHERQPVPPPLRRAAASCSGWIALNGRANAARNPAAIYRDPMTMDDYLSARPISSPFGLYDCDVPCDASIAVIVSDASVAGPTSPSRPSASTRSARRSPSGSPGTRTPSPTSRRCSGSRPTSGAAPACAPADVDVALLYDGFTFNAISWLEAPRLLRARRGARTGSTAAAASPSTASCR